MRAAVSIVIIISEEVSASFLGLLDGGFLGGGLIFLHGGNRNSGGASGGGSLQAVGLGETIIGGKSNGSQVLEGVGDEVGGGGGGDVSGSERAGGEGTGTAGESGEDIFGGNAEALGFEEVAVHHDSLDSHFELERTDLQLIEEGGLARSDLVTGIDDLEVVDNFNLGFHNFGGNVQFLEERGLGRVNSGGTGLDHDILGGDGTDTGGGLTDLGVKDILDFEEISLSENDGSVSFKLGEDLLEVGKGLVRLLALLVVVIFFLGLNHHGVDGGLHHGVLSTDHEGIDSSHLFTEDGDLLGGNVVSVDEQSLVIGVAGGLEGTPELSLSSLGFLYCSHSKITNARLDTINDTYLFACCE